MKTILALKRDGISREEQAALDSTYGDDCQLIVGNYPENPERWHEMCQNQGTTEEVVCLLPFVRPLPCLALEAGYQHVVLGEDGRLYRLVSVEPVLELIE